MAHPLSKADGDTLLAADWNKSLTSLQAESFGALANTSTVGAVGANNTAAVVALAAHQAVSENRNPSVFHKGGREVALTGSGYYFGAGISLKTTARWRGMGVGQAGGESTLFRFPANTGGITVERFDTLNGGAEAVPTTGADGSLFDGLLMQGARGTDDVYKAGFRFRARGTVQNSIIRSFPGAGILVAADTSVPASNPAHGNANNTFISNVRVQANLDGVAMSGGDGNVVNVFGVDASNNRRWGISDTTFLATVLIGCHTDANAQYDATSNTTSYVSHGGRRYSVRAGQDALAGSTTPGTDSQAVWLDEGEGGVIPGQVVAWELNGGASGTTYRAGGSYYINPVGATTPVIGCYYETGQPRPQLINAIALGGFMGTGLIYGGPHLYAAPATGLTQQRPYTQLWTYADNTVATVRLGGNLAEGEPYIDVVAWSSTEATPSNPGDPSALRQHRPTGDLIWRSRSIVTALRLTGPNTARTFGRVGGDNRFITEIRELALGDGNNTDTDNARTMRYGSAAPTTGYHAKGEIVFNNGNTTAIATTSFWHCSAAGTPGTWIAK